VLLPDDGNRTAPVRAARAPAPAAGAPSTHYVITLATPAMPIRAPLPRLPPVIGARVFCDRLTVGGAPHVRIQIGYFESLRSAAQVLRQVQVPYPGATLRGVRLVPRAQPVHPRPPAAPRREVPPAGRTAGQVRAAAAPGWPGLAVELLWSPEPVDLTHVPPLTLFDDHTLYAVAAHRGGHDWHGLRLGFFHDRHCAKAAADEAATYFSGAIAVPVTRTEYEQAQAAEIQPFAARIGVPAIVPSSGGSG
jgi:hypothetical protein